MTVFVLPGHAVQASTVSAAEADLLMLRLEDYSEGAFHLA